MPPPGMFSNPAAVKVPTFPDRTCPVSAGADTAAINAAIASCSAMGGGVVTFAPGTYNVGSIRLKSNVKLQLNGATLRANGNIDPAEPYTTPITCQDEGHSHWRNALLWGENLTNIAIVGPGTLDGRGLDTELQKMISLKLSSVMMFEDLNQVNTGHFAYLLTDCHHITMSKLKIRPSRDGVDLMQCTNVNAHDLDITGGPDDAFALKNDCSIGKQGITDNVTVRDSTFSASIANALQIGSETWGDFQNVTWSNIRVTAGNKAGIGIQMNDGAVIRNVSYENVTMTNVSFPIFISTTALLRGPTKTPGHAENLRFRNITASNIIAGNNPSPQNTAVVVSGLADHPHQNIVFEQIKITFPGGGMRSGDPPEGNTLRGGVAYNPRFITPIPSYGFFIRHAKGVMLRDVKVDFTAADQRPAAIARDVDGLVFDTFSAEKGSSPLLELDGIKDLTIKGSAPLPDTTSPTVGKMTY
jgi:polygalacturonase